MSKATNRIKRRKKAKDFLKNICEQQSNYLIIHYSCESFYDTPQGRTPRVTSIAIRYFDTAQTKSFSIHKIAEFKNVPFDQIENQYDALERTMLDEFFQFIENHKRYYWIHLNMRDINYGFEAINHRYRVLDGHPVEIEDNLKIDLGRLLVDLFGDHYIEHPRVESLCRKNNINMKNFLKGAEEAEAFKNHEHVKLHQSTLRKVDMMHSVVLRAFEGDLKTNTNLIRQYGLSPQSIFQIMQENWLLALFVFLFGVVVSIFFQKWLSGT